MSEPVDAATSRYWGDDATVWVWICYGLAQATITMLMAFDVIKTITPAEITTACVLVVYVAVNELITRPKRRRAEVRRGSAEPEGASAPSVGPPPPEHADVSSS